MGLQQRNKGARGEREFFLKCRAVLVPDACEAQALQRNLSQTRLNGGQDCVGLVGGYSVEVKRTRQWLEAYWAQTCSQAASEGAKPALAHKQDRGRWQVTVRDVDLGVRLPSGRVTLELGDWLALVMDVERI